MRDLWIRAQRTRCVDYPIGQVRRDDLVRRHTVHNPTIESGDDVVIRVLGIAGIIGAIEGIRTWTVTNAVCHAGDHEETVELPYFLDASKPATSGRIQTLVHEKRDDAIVVIDLLLRVNERIAPALIKDRLPPALPERPDVGVEIVIYGTPFRIQSRRVFVEIESEEVGVPKIRVA